MKNREKKNIDCEEYLVTDSEKFNDLIDKIKNSKGDKKKIGNFGNIYSDDSDDNGYDSDDIITTYENKFDEKKNDFPSNKIKKKLIEIQKSDEKPTKSNDEEIYVNKSINNSPENQENEENQENIVDFLNKLMYKLNDNKNNENDEVSQSEILTDQKQTKSKVLLRKLFVKGS